ncbi:unnamed protein product [Auanema sp. JU1783]|nr:unnamed protein product [Auanema sp. JU1783]
MASCDAQSSFALPIVLSINDTLMMVGQNDGMPLPAQTQLAVIILWIIYCIGSSLYPSLGPVQVQKSFRQLFNCRPSDLAFLDKYRVFAIVWVMMNHLGSEGRTDILLRLPSGEDFKKNVHDHPIFGPFLGNSALGVEIFLVLSGILSAVSWFSKEREPFWPHYWSFEKKRYLRIAPSVVVFIIFAGGPLMSYLMPRFSDSMTSTCPNVGYLSHIFFFANLREAPTCLGYLWYLGLDFQLYLIVPLLYTLTFKSIRFFYGIIGSTVVLSMIARAAHCAFYGVCNNSGVDIPFISFPNQTELELKQIYGGIYQLYGRPHTKCGPFLTAAAFGVFLVFYKRNRRANPEQRIQLTATASRNLFYTSLTVAITTIYAILPEYWEPEADTNMYNMIYTATFRTVFAMAIIGMVASRLFGPDTEPVSIWWTVLGKLSFNVFLLHMPIVFVFNKLNYLQEAEGAIELLVVLPVLVIISFIAAFFFHIFVESPIADIIRYAENSFIHKEDKRD